MGLKHLLDLNVKTINEQGTDIKKAISESVKDTRIIMGQLEKNLPVLKDLFNVNSKSNNEIGEYTLALRRALDVVANDSKVINASIREYFSVLDHDLKDTNAGIKTMDQTLQQIGCDSKDLNQSLFKLASFLDEIERHLDLKR
jgi:methyl-accepting chemotaxis protein